MAVPAKDELGGGNVKWFTEARFGMFIHYGLYSLLERSEWVLNRERIPLDEYKRLTRKFTAEKFDAGYICDLAVKTGMKYVNLTTMHHDGFRLYDSELSDFNAQKSAAGRDLVAEFVKAARERGLKVALYHSLNNWMDQPDAVKALENPKDYEVFIRNTHERIRELVTKFNPIDVLWYDGWWPFNADGWQAVKMNDMVSKIQPQIIFNGRNGLPGDFCTPEGHMSAPHPWKPWEACMTLNDHWGFHRGDNEWKTPKQVAGLLINAAAGNGNLLLNIGPHGDGSIPGRTVEILEEVGQWVGKNKESIFQTEPFTFGLEKREGRGDWSLNGSFTSKGNNLYYFVRYWVGGELTIAGLQCKVLSVALLGSKTEKVEFVQQGEKLTLKGLPEKSPDPICPVVRLECDRAPEIYLTGGMRVPNAVHPPYDPCPSDIKH